MGLLVKVPLQAGQVCTVCACGVFLPACPPDVILLPYEEPVLYYYAMRTNEQVEEGGFVS